MSHLINQPPGVASILLTVASKEFRDCVRGRWLGVGAVLFTVLSLAIVYGTAAIGGTLDFRDLPVAMNSLVSLTVFLLPLLALLISSDAFVGEEESGTLLLMLTYPLTRTEWLIGKLAGQGAALLCALVLGYLPLMLLSVFGFLPYAPQALAAELFKLCSSGWLLGLITTLAAFCVSLTVSSKARALGVLLLIWLLLVLLYDLALLVLSIAAADVLDRSVMQLLVLINPASAFRLLNQMLLGITEASVSVAALVGILGAWIAALFALAASLIKRRSL